MIQKWSKFVQHWFKHGPKMVINDPKIVRIWSKKGATSPSVMVLSAVYQQLIINSSSVHGQFIISSSSVCHQFIISSSSAHYQLIISSLSIHHKFIIICGSVHIIEPYTFKSEFRTIVRSLVVFNAAKHSDMLQPWRLTCSTTLERGHSKTHNATI